MALIETHTVINAPPDKVWSILADFDHWADWTTSFTEVHLEGPAQIGTPLTFMSRIQDPKRPTKTWARLTKWNSRDSFAWIGGGLAWWLEWIISGEHWFKLESDGDGKTRLTHGEMINGALKFVVGDTIKSRIHESLVSFNNDLKSMVERA